MKFYTNVFNSIISTENLFLAWDEFKKDKLKKKDVLAYEWSLEKNILALHKNLEYHTYKHGVYHAFFITDPKLREIHKATVADRVLHHAIFRTLNPLFEPTFISHSFSCRVGKGTHKGVDAIDKMLLRVSLNHQRTCYALKCDIQKFFGSVDHEILLKIIKRKIKDPDTIWLLDEIIESFETKSRKQPTLFDLRPQIERERERERERTSTSSVSAKRGIPIGNLTSQLFANIYMNEFDQFIKQHLKVQNYARYTDDFIIISDDFNYLQGLIPEIQSFSTSNLKLKLHPNKVTIRKYKNGIDFLGYVVLPRYMLLRGKTRKRIVKKLKIRVRDYKSGLIREETLKQSLSSYLGVLSHANSRQLREQLLNIYIEGQGY